MASGRGLALWGSEAQGSSGRTRSGAGSARLGRKLEQLEINGLKAGADDFLTKPVNDLALFARIRSLVRRKGKLHAKWTVVDGKRVLTGSFNWTESAQHKNMELIFVNDEPGSVKRFQEIFETLWDHAEPEKL